MPIVFSNTICMFKVEMFDLNGETDIQEHELLLCPEQRDPTNTHLFQSNGIVSKNDPSGEFSVSVVPKPDSEKNMWQIDF